VSSVDEPCDEDSDVAGPCEDNVLARVGQGNFATGELKDLCAGAGASAFIICIKNIYILLLCP
jgi:hypothetical protein